MKRYGTSILALIVLFGCAEFVDAATVKGEKKAKPWTTALFKFRWFASSTDPHAMRKAERWLEDFLRRMEDRSKYKVTKEERLKATPALGGTLRYRSFHLSIPGKGNFTGMLRIFREFQNILKVKGVLRNSSVSVTLTVPNKD